MEVSVLNINGQETGRKATLNEAIFAIEPNDHVLYLNVKQYLANQRQGTAKSKERSELSGSTRKLIRQKGSGGARRGDINSPVLVGGARVFGPKPRDYSFKLNKKVKILARKSALSYKAKENAIIVVEDFTMDAPKTKDFVNIAKNLKVDGKKLLLVLPTIDKNVYLSARNLQGTNVMLEYGVESVYDETLRHVHRGHDFATAERAIRLTAQYNIPCGAHFIFGLPGETKAMMLEAADVMADLPLNTVKFHQLQIFKGTVMAEEYLAHPEHFHLFDLEEYIDFVIDFAERLNPDMVIERFAGNTCGPRPTSCPDQLAIALREAYAAQQEG